MNKVFSLKLVFSYFYIRRIFLVAAHANIAFIAVMTMLPESPLYNQKQVTDENLNEIPLHIMAYRY